MSDDDDVPPLEDMSHQFKTVPAAMPAASATSATPSALPQESAKETADQKPLPGVLQSSAAGKQQQKAGFGGMRSGFLVQKSQPQPQQQPQQHHKDPPDNLPFIRSNPEASVESLRLPEVQDSLRSSSAGDLADKSWITEDLLAKVESNPDLLRRLSDPRMSSALARFQSDPAGAMREFTGNPEVLGLLKEFAGILGEHFTSVADRQEAETAKTQQASQSVQPAAVDPEVEEVLSRPGVREALTNADVQRWMGLLKSQPDRAVAVLRSSGDPEFQARIRVLFENGLVGIAK